MPYKTRDCEMCGTPWTTRNPNSRTCSMKCAAVLREREHPSPGKKRDYPPEIVDQVREMYHEGYPIKEIDRAIGPGFYAYRIIQRYIPERRKRPTPAGVRSPHWKEGAGYQALHLRIEKERGKPQYCACCDITDPQKKYYWANLSGDYGNVNDYARMCQACHMRLDARRRVILGGSTMEIAPLLKARMRYDPR